MGRRYKQSYRDQAKCTCTTFSTGSTAAGVGEAMEDNEVAAAVMKAVEKGAEMAGEMMEEEDNNENDEEKDDEKDVDDTGEQNED